MDLIGNIVTPDDMFWGRLHTDGLSISGIEARADVKPDEDWIVAGFIDVHLHGLGAYDAFSPEGVAGMASVAPGFGVTALLPTLACAPESEMLRMVEVIRDIARAPHDGARIPGCHLEGPWLDPAHGGGMSPRMIRMPSIAEAERFLTAAEGTLKLITIAPERPGAPEVIRLLQRAGVRVSAGHTGLKPEDYENAVAAGVRQFCHLYDVYDLPESREGVRQPALTDLVLCDDRVMKEIIMDGMHVPPALISLARRAAGAEHIVAITDAMQGAGLEYGRFLDVDEWYVVRAGELARREKDNAIVGSSLTMNRAFHNMVTKFGFTPVEASRAASANPAEVAGLGGKTGMLKPGMLADITVLAPDMLTVKDCMIAK